MYLIMGHLLVVLVLLWGSGLQAEGKHQSTELVRLVGGASHCTGKLEVKKREWRPVEASYWTMKESAVACRELDCGSAVSTERINEYSSTPVWRIKLDCVRSGSALTDCAVSLPSSPNVELTCSDSVRLVNGSSLCSGRLEVKSEQSWSSVCEADFDQQDAEVVCRELGCGAPSVLQGALYGEVEAPMGTKEFQCGGHESTLLDCGRSDSTRSTCSPGKAVGLTCSDPVRLVGGAGHCADSVRLVNGSSLCSGRLEVKSEQSWSSVCEADFDQQDAEVVCRELGCGAPTVLQGALYGEVEAPMWTKEFQCGGHESTLLDCGRSDSTRSTCSPGKAVGLTCSDPVRLVGGASRCADSVRLVNGSSLCSGRLEVKSEQSWSSVCEADFDQQDAEVVCRELGCGAPTVLQGALYGEVEAPMWTKEFQCGGHESTLLDCGRSDSTRSTCSPGKAVGLTCSDPVRLVGGASRCADSVRLVNGSSLCSGRLEVKSEQSWSSVCEADFDQQDAEVVCRELGCGAPTVLQGALYGEVEAPMWTKEFQCGGHESTLLDCGRSDSTRSTCSPGKAVGLTCSDPVRLVGGASRCADSVRLVNGSSLCSGRLEVKSEQSWSSVCEADFDQQDAEVVCRELGCGAPTVLQGALYGEVEAPMWTKEFQCGGHESTLLDCGRSDSTRSTCSPGKAVGLTCSDPVRLVGGASRCADSVRLVNGSSLCSGRLEVKSEQSWSSVCEADFDQQDAEVVCRELGCGAPTVLQGALYGEVEAPMGTKEFQCGGHESTLLDCGRSDSTRSTCSSGKAVGLTCSEPIRLVGGASRCAGALEVKRGEWRPVDTYLSKKLSALASRGQMSGPQENIELDYYNFGVSRGEGEPPEEEGAQGAE
ncbi:hypothetical protein PAMP_009877 [Pampus punctatissimus]